MGASATKWHCQPDAGATQRAVVKLIDRNAAIQAENEAATKKNGLMTGHEPNIQQAGNLQLPRPSSEAGSSRYSSSERRGETWQREPGFMSSVLSENMPQKPLLITFVPAATQLTQGSKFLLGCVSVVPYSP